MIGRRKKHNFTIVANKCVNDNRLSLQAKGLMLIMMSNDEEWDFYLKEISNRSSNGIDGTRTALHELEKYGYLFRYRERNSDGTLGNTVWSFDDEGQVDTNPQDMGCSTKIGFSYIGSTKIGQSNANKTNNKKTKSKKTNLLRKKVSKNDNNSLMSFVNDLRKNLAPKGDNYPTLSVGALKLGLNNKKLLYDKATQRILDPNEAMELFKHVASHYTGKSFSTDKEFLYAYK